MDDSEFDEFPKKNPIKASSFERLPPHDIEAEQGVLGSILCDPKRICECVDVFKDGQEVFYDLRHQVIYETMLKLTVEMKVVDVVTMNTALRDINMLDQIGGIAYLSALPEMSMSAWNISAYIETVQSKFLLRKMIQTNINSVTKIYEHAGDVDPLLDEIEQDVLKVRRAHGRKSILTMKELVNQALIDLEAAHQRQGQLIGLPTGFLDFDRMTGGLQPGNMIVLAARPSLGKTSLAMNIADHVAIEHKTPVAVFSLEMTDRELVRRILLSRARVNSNNARDGRLVEGDFPKLTSAAGKCSKAPIYIDDESGLTVMQVKARMRRMCQEFGIKFGVIDYLQLMHGISRKNNHDTREREVAEISQGVKELSKELDIPILVLSQLNRSIERDKNRKPRLSDLRESGAVEQDADVVSFLYKKKVEDDEDEDDTDVVPTNLLVAKQRNGPTGDIALTFFKSFTRFESCARVSDEDPAEYRGNPND